MHNPAMWFAAAWIIGVPISWAIECNMGAKRGVTWGFLLGSFFFGPLLVAFLITVMTVVLPIAAVGWVLEKLAEKFREKVSGKFPTLHIPSIPTPSWSGDIAFSCKLPRRKPHAVARSD